ncbi:MAG: efflux RND transporter periplasmic adaptor subunit [Deltaproteobacteria bacterium]|nr:efflux RND transporter periplasmic adaptor subunit [Deltaproteobacteria bacterium]
MTTTIFLCAALALAHGGEDHGAPPPVVGTGDERRAEASSETFELVLRWDAGRGAAETDLDLFLADPSSNRPIAEARISLRLTSGDRRESVDAKAGARPGTYYAHLPASPDGAWAAIATIDAGGESDLLTFARIDLRADEDAHAGDAPADHEDEHGLGFFLVVGLALVGATALAFVAGRASRGATRGAALVLIAGALAAASTDDAAAHGGDDHGAPATTTAAGRGDIVTLPKEIQFLLGLETAPATTRVMVPRLRVAGEVVAPPDALAILRAPRAGRLEAPAERLRAIGQRVIRGEMLAWVIDVPAGPERATLAAERARAKASGEGAAARLGALRKELARKEALAGTVAPQEIEALRARIRETEAEVRAARAAADALDLQGDVLRVPLVAPFDGLVVGWRDGLAIGGSVGADVDLVTLVAPERLEVGARVFEDDAARVARDGRAVGRTSDGRTLELDPAGSAPRIDPTTRTIELRYTPRAPLEPPLTLGAWVTVDVPVGAGASRVVVPQQAVVERDGVPTVYVKIGAERFQPVPVVVRVREGDAVGVEGDLGAGARVVVSGAQLLRHAAPAPTPTPSGGAR